MVKLTGEEVLLIKTLRNEGFTILELSGFFRTSPRNVALITSNKSWQHLQRI